MQSMSYKTLPGVHVEVKRVERLNIHEAMQQSIRDSNDQALPIVAHRRNRGEWYITMRAADFFIIYREWEKKGEKQCLKNETRI